MVYSSLCRPKQYKNYSNKIKVHKTVNIRRVLTRCTYLKTFGDLIHDVETTKNEGYCLDFLEWIILLDHVLFIISEEF
jgi:hypothetical protein